MAQDAVGRVHSAARMGQDRPMAAAKKRSSPQALDPTAFFEVACPRVLHAMRSLLAERGGRFAVVVEGPGGGTWCLDFAAAAVSQGPAAADVTIHLTLPQFVSLSSGRVELRKLIVDGEVPCEGQRERLEDLSLVLAFLSR